MPSIHTVRGIQLSALSHSSFANASACYPHTIVATTYSILHLLLTCNAARTSATFLYELNYPILYKTAYLPEALFNAAAIDPMMLTYLSNGPGSYTFHYTKRRAINVTFISKNLAVVRTPSQAKPEKQKDDSKIASKNSQEELGLKTTWQAQLEHIQTNQNISALIITPLMTYHSFR